MSSKLDNAMLERYQVAGNGLLDRRLFLKRGLQFGVIASLASMTTKAKQPLSRILKSFINFTF